MVYWFVIIWPDFYDDPFDTGYSWVGKAKNYGDSVLKALAACLKETGWEKADAEQYYKTAKIELARPYATEMVRVIDARPDWERACRQIAAVFNDDREAELKPMEIEAVRGVKSYLRAHDQ